MVVGSRPGGPPWSMVLAACRSATLGHVVGGSTIRCFAPPPLDSLAYMRPLASWSLTVDSSGVSDVFTNPYQTGVLTVRNWMVLLVWWGGPLPILTTRHMQDPLVFGQVLRGITTTYHALPCLRSEYLHRFLTFTSHHLRPDTHTDTHIDTLVLSTAQSEHGRPK